MSQNILRHEKTRESWSRWFVQAEDPTGWSARREWQSAVCTPENLWTSDVWWTVPLHFPLTTAVWDEILISSQVSIPVTITTLFVDYIFQNTTHHKLCFSPSPWSPLAHHTSWDNLFSLFLFITRTQDEAHFAAERDGGKERGEGCCCARLQNPFCMKSTWPLSIHVDAVRCYGSCFAQQTPFAVNTHSPPLYGCTARTLYWGPGARPAVEGSLYCVCYEKWTEGEKQKKGVAERFIEPPFNRRFHGNATVSLAERTEGLSACSSITSKTLWYVCTLGAEQTHTSTLPVLYTSHFA